MKQTIASSSNVSEMHILCVWKVSLVDIQGTKVLIFTYPCIIIPKTLVMWMTMLEGKVILQLVLTRMWDSVDFSWFFWSSPWTSEIGELLPAWKYQIISRHLGKKSFLSTCVLKYEVLKGIMLLHFCLGYLRSCSVCQRCQQAALFCFLKGCCFVKYRASYTVLTKATLISWKCTAGINLARCEGLYHLSNLYLKLQVGLSAVSLGGLGQALNMDLKHPWLEGQFS